MSVPVATYRCLNGGTTNGMRNYQETALARAVEALVASRMMTGLRHVTIVTVQATNGGDEHPGQTPLAKWGIAQKTKSAQIEPGLNLCGRGTSSGLENPSNR